MAHVMDLINQAHMSVDATEKVDILQRVKETLLERTPTFGRSVAEYKAVMDALVSFSNERNVSVAKFLLQFIEEIMDPVKNPQIKTPPILAQTRLTLFDACCGILTINAGPSSIRKALKVLDKYIPGTIYHIWAQPLEALDPHVWEALVRTIQIMQQTLHQFQDAEAVVWIIRILESCALHFSAAKDSVFRDPARSNIQPDAVHLDTIAPGHAFLRVDAVAQLGDAIVQSLVDRMQSAPTNPLLAFQRREYLVLVHALSLLAFLRPDYVALVVPCLISVPALIERLPNAVQDTIIHATKANLLKLLALPSTQAHRNAITDVLITYGLSERAFKAHTKAKERRRKYVSAPSGASLQNVKRDAAKISFESPMAKRAKREPAASVTSDSIVNMQTESVIEMVLNNMPNLAGVAPLAPSGAKLELLHTPSGLKNRMLALLSQLATPSSVLAIKEAAAKKNVRDPRLRGREKKEAAPPSLVSIFDEEALEAVTDMICANAKTLVEPIIAVTKDEVTREYNAIKVNIKPVATEWCKQMAQQTIQRLLGNEYGVVVSGKEEVRETLVCRLATSRWLVEDDRVKPHKVIVDFVGENIHKRHSIVVSLMYHEYTTSLYETMETGDDAKTTALPRVYVHLIQLVCGLVRTKLDPKVSADKKLFYHILSHIPSLTPDVLRVITLQFHDPSDKDRVTMGVVALRNFITERTRGQEACLHVLLHFATHKEESIRNLTIRCLANQIYPLPNMHAIIEGHASELLQTLRVPQEDDVAAPTEVIAEPMTAETGAETETVDIKTEPKMMEVSAADDLKIKIEPQEDDPMGQATTTDAADDEDASQEKPTSPRRRYYLTQIQSPDLNEGLMQFAKTLQAEHDFSIAPQTEDQVLQRMELFLALCAKRPDLFSRFVTTYASTGPEVQHVLLASVDKLIKLLRQKEGELVVLAQLRPFPPKALDFVLHVVKVLATLSKDPASLVEPLLELYEEHKHIPEAIAIVIPIAAELPSDRVMAALPLLFELSSTRVVEVMQEILKPIPLKVDATTFLLALHHIPDEAEKQKRILRAIGLCLEHPVAFPVDVMTSVTSTLVAESPIPKYTLRTMIQAVQMHHKLRKHIATCLESLAARRVWEMDESLWIGWLKCAVVIQPHSFKAIAELAVDQGAQVFAMDEGKDMLDPFKAFCNEFDALTPEWRAHLKLQANQVDEVPEVNNPTTESDPVALPSPVDAVLTAPLDSFEAELQELDE
ncbi:Aste57867_21598 [Aphanomyces stellatus]|uniref:Aste57867_21598 protein n=1 Tax=Aphanomyces stellatus TaxID=120398 RepID=A0A485LMS2_9STRA|nr:hypothetical protein As57867_021529 [Aphanomyces stellatus]VFT98268.1 Aste57867_21598 [Aphanomyces stellatus]